MAKQLQVVKKQRQQGDVLLELVSEVPKGAKRVERKLRGFVLAEGEATGHAHVIEAQDDAVEMYEKDGQLYVRLASEQDLVHEEHKTQTVEPGVWKVNRVQEKDWTSGMVAPVQD